jgi:hypothetical protein
MYGIISCIANVPFGVPQGGHLFLMLYYLLMLIRTPDYSSWHCILILWNGVCLEGIVVTVIPGKRTGPAYIATIASRDSLILE